MSTRRARIKAVASLPVRRKNNETNRTSAPEPEKTAEVPRKPDLTSEILNSSQSNAEPTSPAVKNESMPVHTPKVRRTPTIRTPNLIERVPSTPRSAFASASPRRSSPLLRSASPSQKQSPIVKPATPNLANTLLQKALQNYKPGSEASKQPREDYNPPSIPESETDDTVLDGIVPLSNRRPENPINVLKNEIISEYAEVLFDPIVPLPSPSKVRPKLRPAPRFPIRRNSVQGSASESEDEKRAQLSSGSGATPAPPRARHDSHTLSQGSLHALPIVNRELHRVRNDSVCSVGTAGSQPAPGVPASPLLKDKLVSKSRRTEASRRAAAMKRRRAREDVARSEMTMYDLIFYNPTTNPIVRDEEDKVVEAQAEVQPPKAAEEAVDDPPEAAEAAEAAEESAAPVPQIKLGPNGEIILDEKSLVIEQTEIKRKLSTSIVHESAWASSGKGRYSRARRTAEWAPDETVRFYRALAAVGTDFTLMEPLFPGRTRRDLKCKFKKEERLNGAQVDKALRSQTHWDGNRLEGVFTEERRVAAKKAADEKAAYVEQKRQEKMRMKAAKEDGFRTSRALKAVETVNGLAGGPGSQLTADAFIRKAMATRSRKPPRVVVPEPPRTEPITIPPPPDPHYATLTMLNRKEAARSTAATPEATTPNLAVITPTAELPEMSKNIETGSLVVLTVNDPSNPAKKMLQTYISHGNGKLTPVALPSTLLNSVVSYMKKGTPKSTVSNSPNFMSPNSASQDSTRSSVITLNPSPHKRSRHNSYNITQL